MTEKVIESVHYESLHTTLVSAKMYTLRSASKWVNIRADEQTQGKQKMERWKEQKALSFGHLLFTFVTPNISVHEWNKSYCCGASDPAAHPAPAASLWSHQRFQFFIPWVFSPGFLAVIRGAEALRGWTVLTKPKGGALQAPQWLDRCSAITVAWGNGCHHPSYCIGCPHLLLCHLCLWPNEKIYTRQTDEVSARITGEHVTAFNPISAPSWMSCNPNAPSMKSLATTNGCWQESPTHFGLVTKTKLQQKLGKWKPEGVWAADTFKKC